MSMSGLEIQQKNFALPSVIPITGKETHSPAHIKIVGNKIAIFSYGFSSLLFIVIANNRLLDNKIYTSKSQQKHIIRSRCLVCSHMVKRTQGVNKNTLNYSIVVVVI